MDMLYTILIFTICTQSKQSEDWVMEGRHGHPPNWPNAKGLFTLVCVCVNILFELSFSIPSICFCVTTGTVLNLNEGWRKHKRYVWTDLKDVHMKIWEKLTTLWKIPHTSWYVVCRKWHFTFCNYVYIGTGNLINRELPHISEKHNTF